MTSEATTVPLPEGRGLLADATAILPEIIAVRRRLHRRPEIGLQLPETQAVVVEALRAIGLEPHLGTRTTSVTAVIEGATEGPTILLRGDMDALPLQEDTGLEFTSEQPGVMHACGHDTHVAMLLGAARVLLTHREAIAGRVLLMFQPGEEGYHGAREMIADGLLEGDGATDITGAFAIHIGTRYPTGTINIRPGALLASGDRLEVTVRGRGGHASAPHLALDPITIAAEIVLALQLMVTRRIDVFDPAVITIGQLVAGTTNNIIPESATLIGTIRTVSAKTRSEVHAEIQRVVAGIAAAHGATADVDIEQGYPVTVNDPDFSRFVQDVAEDVVGAESVRELAAPIMGAEDFSYVLERVPGAMAFLGARPAAEDPATAPQNHSNKVIFDEQPMAAGIALYAHVAIRHLANRPMPTSG